MKEQIAALAKTGGGTFASLLLGAGVAKILALTAGPSGIALYGQIRTLAQMLILLATANGQTALVRGLAARDEEGRKAYARAVVPIYVAGTAAVAIAVIALAPAIAHLLFARSDAALIGAVRALAGVAAGGALANYVLGVLNGYRAIGRLALIQIAGSGSAFLLAYPAARWGSPLAYVCLVASLHVTIAGLGLIALRLRGRRRSSPLATAGGVPPLRRDLMREHLGLTAVFLATGIIGMASHVALRAIYIDETGFERAGFFEASWTLGTMYLMLLLSSFGTYYQPTLAGCKDPASIRRCMKQTLRLALILGVPLIGLAVAAKPFLIVLLYTDDFMPALEIFRWMLIGDYFKLICWVLGMPLIAFAERRTFFLVETATALALVTSVHGLIAYDFAIAGMAFLGVHVVYAVFIAAHVHRRYGFRFKPRDIVSLLSGLAFIGGLSALTWTDPGGAGAIPITVWVGASLIFVLITATADDRRGARRFMRSLFARMASARF